MQPMFGGMKEIASPVYSLVPDPSSQPSANEVCQDFKVEGPTIFESSLAVWSTFVQLY